VSRIGGIILGKETDKHNLITLKTGVEIQYIATGQHNQVGTLYKPVKNNYPLFGFKPYLTLGLQFNLNIKE